jgi:hypothetical protein
MSVPLSARRGPFDVKRPRVLRVIKARKAKDADA